MILRPLALLSTATLIAGCGATTPEPEPPAAPPVVEVAATTPDVEPPLADDEPEEAPVDQQKEEHGEQELSDAELARKKARKLAAEGGILGLIQASKGSSGVLDVKGTGTSAVVSGALDKNIVRRIVRKHIPKFRYCYERQLVKAPNLSGKIVLKFVIGADGKVTKSEALESLHPDVDRCVTKSAAGMVFPAPKGKGIVIVRYPLVFSPGSQGQAPKSKTPKAPKKP